MVSQAKALKKLVLNIRKATKHTIMSKQRKGLILNFFVNYLRYTSVSN